MGLLLGLKTSFNILYLGHKAKLTLGIIEEVSYKPTYTPGIAEEVS